MAQEESGESVSDVVREVAASLGQLSAAVEAALGSAPEKAGGASAEWVASLITSSSEARRSLQVQLQRLTQAGMEVDGLQEWLGEMERAFVAPSLEGRWPAPRVISLLLGRILAFVHGILCGIVEGARERALQQLVARCVLLARGIESVATRSNPYDSPGMYRAIFGELAKRMGEVESPPASADSREPDAAKAPPDWVFKSARQKRTVILSVPAEDASATSFRGGASSLRDSSGRGGDHDSITTPVRIPEIEPELLKQDSSGRTHRIWYGTERTPVDPRDPSLGFSAIAGDELHLGSCLVFVPKSHQVGSLGSSWVMRTLFGRGDDRVQLKSVRRLEASAFVEAISNALSARQGLRSALVFVHGYNVSFEEAACRAAQMACDLCVDGVTAFYSWASAGNWHQYAADEETVRWAAGPFREFLETLQTVHGLERIDVVAHSMGNRLVAAAIKDLATTRHTAPIGHLVLAAPDLARGEFNGLFPHYSALARRVTLYSCAKDKPLALSTRLHSYLRLGAEPPVYCRPGLDTISASRLPLDLLAHGFVASAKAVIADMKQLLWEDAPPAMRNLLAVPDVETAEYWVL